MYGYKRMSTPQKSFCSADSGDFETGRYVYAADENDDWTLPRVWAKANPSLGITVAEEKLQIACENARQNPANENLFKQLRLCIWVKQSIR
jgi:phage terminase large subunit-like protein